MGVSCAQICLYNRAGQCAGQLSCNCPAHACAAVFTLGSRRFKSGSNSVPRQDQGKDTRQDQRSFKVGSMKESESATSQLKASSKSIQSQHRCQYGSHLKARIKVNSKSVQCHCNASSKSGSTSESKSGSKLVQGQDQLEVSSM